MYVAWCLTESLQEKYTDLFINRFV